jgi:ABC-type multidrug transport system fused ATPase/permease subunit
VTEPEKSSEALLKGLEEGYDGLRASLSVQSVTLTYPGADRPAVNNVMFEVVQGASVALVGSTGSGKSTLADIILGVLEPEEGRVLIGGFAPGDVTRRWPGSVTYVPQDIAVVDGTVRDNVALGLTPEMTYDERVWEALDRAQLSSLLRGSRQGLDTLVGEHGVRLSGGQKQRLGLARALYSRPTLLVLDEATSALDAETELAVSDALTALEGAVTTVTIAHRLATVRHCDLVIYLEHGRVVASGTFAEVREASQSFDRQARLLGL